MARFIEKDQNVFAIVNSDIRDQDSDVIISVPLNKAQLQTYHEMKDDGSSNTQIFQKLFPAPTIKSKKKPTLSLSVNDLTKVQLISLLESSTHKPLPTLENADLEDLRALAGLFLKGAEVTLQ